MRTYDLFVRMDRKEKRGHLSPSRLLLQDESSQAAAQVVPVLIEERVAGNVQGVRI